MLGDLAIVEGVMGALEAELKISGSNFKGFRFSAWR